MAQRQVIPRHSADARGAQGVPDGADIFPAALRSLGRRMRTLPVPSPPGWSPASGPKSSAPFTPSTDLACAASECRLTAAAAKAGASLLSSSFGSSSFCGSWKAEAAQAQTASMVERIGQEDLRSAEIALKILGTARIWKVVATGP